MTKLTPAQIVLMRKAGEITAAALKLAQSMVSPGITTLEIDKKIEEFILSQGAKPNFKHYNGYPKSICASVNEVVIHGIPSGDIILQEGDIISIDLGVNYKGFHGDAARTFPVGQISEELQKLIEVTKQAFFEGIRNFRAGGRRGEISCAIQTYVEKFGFSVVREFVGHGIGSKLHLDPSIPNYGKKTDGEVIPANVCLAIEPMVNLGGKEVFLMDDDWGVVTRDGKPSAHYENTVLVTETGIEILTL